MVVSTNGAINVIDITNGLANATQALSVESESAVANMFVAGRGIAGENADMQLVTLNGNTLTLYGHVEPVVVAPLYITGANVGGNWDPANAAEFEFNGEIVVLLCLNRYHIRINQVCSRAIEGLSRPRPISLPRL